MSEAAELRARASACIQEAADSFERCDTDGFLSQWASGINASLYERKAEIAENGGKWKFRGLYEGDRRVLAKAISARYGVCWMLDASEEERFGRKFVSFGSRSKAQREFGLRERDEEQAAGADLAGEVNVGVRVFRLGDQWGRDAVLVGE